MEKARMAARTYESHYGPLNWVVPLRFTQGEIIGIASLTMGSFSAAPEDISATQAFLDSMAMKTKERESKKTSSTTEGKQRNRQYHDHKTNIIRKITRKIIRIIFDHFFFHFSSFSSSHVGPRLLLTHVPLSRDFVKNEGCGKHRESNKEDIRRGFGNNYRTTLEQMHSLSLLETIKPDLILSGDDHAWCEVDHVSPDGRKTREVTVGTASWLQGSVWPSIAIVKPAQSGFDYQPCFLVPQLKVYFGYIFLALVSLVVGGWNVVGGFKQGLALTIAFLMLFSPCYFATLLWYFVL